MKKTKKETPTSRIPQTFEAVAADFERSKIEEIKKSRKIAWIIAGVCIAVTALSIFAFLVALLTRAEPEPTIIEVDKSTGISNVLRSIKDEQDTYHEVINKYWLAQYVRFRASYDWFTINSQFEAVKLMSSPDVRAEYEKWVQAPDAPLTLLKDKGKIKTEIVSITFIEKHVAQVRFTTQKLSPSGENIDNSPLQRWIATIAFKFDAGWMTDQQRLVNPLGFKAISYRVDPEVLK